MNTPEHSPVPKQPTSSNEGTNESLRARLDEIERIIKEYEDGNKEKMEELRSFLEENSEEYHKQMLLPTEPGSLATHPFNVARKQYQDLMKPAWLSKLKQEELSIKLALSNKPVDQFIEEDLLGR